ncbi:glycoside hydrolase family 5 protein [Piedraia hortae CBS 480.64]|uniref:glucan 1,3-beta-glucosidase n=1 Tax=Piedraia hortae CBS 480.64 TaxID=1314780 RepID=A0A6A7BR34_9PEZI|nr:glycoside hydrolase family 5 protein [Piedraia hortae CBS 480.64]
MNQALGWDAEPTPLHEERRHHRRRDPEEELERERRRERRRRRREDAERRRREEERLAEESTERRIVSGRRLERGHDRYYNDKEPYREDARLRDGGSSDYEYESERKRKRRRNICIAISLLLLILVIVVPVAIVLSKKKKSETSQAAAGDSGPKPSNDNLNGIKQSDIPQQYQGTELDPFTWYDTNDFNVTFTPVLVGGLPIMGLNTSWDDSPKANPHTKSLNETWKYGTDLIRGVNLGGWLSLEPLITPSLFSSYSSRDGIVDEYTLCKKLGDKAKQTLEKHYSTFISEQTFADIQAAGFDHVRIPFSYWAVTTYGDDPYVPKTSFRYLLRGIEWARKYGLRVNLDLHAAPGSQNGWNHSGRQGTIGWLNGTDGTLNGQRTIDIHNQLSTFFTQLRYRNVVTMYGLVNEPRMVELDQGTVIDWTKKAIATVRGNGYKGVLIFGDGFMGLDNWQGKLQDEENLLLDVHQYVIFNTQQLVLTHHDKINFACGGWTEQALRSSNKATGFGPTLCGEWSQADTDCAQYLNNVGIGSRWEGTLNTVGTPGGSRSGSVLSPTCPTANKPRCDCTSANADPSTYAPAYKQWLLMFAEAQMHSFERGWGWFYWTWQTESAPQWSYKDGLAAGILPKLAYQRDFDCSQEIPMFNDTGLPEFY